MYNKNLLSWLTLEAKEPANVTQTLVPFRRVCKWQPRADASDGASCSSSRVRGEWNGPCVRVVETNAAWCVVWLAPEKATKAHRMDLLSRMKTNRLGFSALS